MRISALFKLSPQQKQLRLPQSMSHKMRGFTLVEIMLVLLVIGVMVGMATLALGNNPARELDTEARRLQAVLNMASEEAVTRGIELALAVLETAENNKAYQLLVLDTESMEWGYVSAGLADSELFSLHHIDAKIDWQLELEGETISDRQMEQISAVMAFNTPDNLRPAILLLSSGEITPFRLQLGHMDTDYQALLQTDGISGVFLR